MIPAIKFINKNDFLYYSSTFFILFRISFISNSSCQPKYSIKLEKQSRNAATTIYILQINCTSYNSHKKVISPLFFHCWIKLQYCWVRLNSNPIHSNILEKVYLGVFLSVGNIDYKKINYIILRQHFYKPK